MTPHSGVTNEGTSVTSIRALGADVTYRSMRYFRLVDLKRLGWSLFIPATYVNWCGHTQEQALKRESP